MLNLNEDGTIDLDIGAGPIVLRRPKLGEFRTLREAAWAHSAESTAAVAALDGLDDEPRRKATHEYEHDNEGRWARWAIQVVAALAPDGAPTPDGEDGVDAFATTAGFARLLLDHWRDIPLARGGPRPPT